MNNIYIYSFRNPKDFVRGGYVYIYPPLTKSFGLRIKSQEGWACQTTH